MPRRQINFKMMLDKLRWSVVKQKFFAMLDQQVLEMKEKPRRVALGCALGLSVNFIPTFGVGFIIAYFLALLFRANQVSAAATSLLTGPLIPIKYGLNLLVGSLIMAGDNGNERFFEFVAGQYAAILKIGCFREQLLGFLDFFGTTFILGTVFNAVFFGAAFYFGVQRLLKKRFNRPEA